MVALLSGAPRPSCWPCRWSVPPRRSANAEAAVQDVIQRGNAAQAQALATSRPDRSWQIPPPTRTTASWFGPIRACSIRESSRIELVNLEWGPIAVGGATATATTFETWRTSYSEGPTDFSRDRNVYSLVRDAAGSGKSPATTTRTDATGATRHARPAGSRRRLARASSPGSARRATGRAMPRAAARSPASPATWTVPGAAARRSVRRRRDLGRHRRLAHARPDPGRHPASRVGQRQRPATRPGSKRCRTSRTRCR